LYSSTSIIKMIKCRRMRWVGHVARMGEGRKDDYAAAADDDDDDDDERM
jgi:hypothetical protein